MTQEERWNIRYEEVKNFILNNHRTPSKYAPEEKLMCHFLKRNRKLLNAYAKGHQGTGTWHLFDLPRTRPRGINLIGF